MSKAIRLKYVFIGGQLKQGSVQHKIDAQIRELNNHGIEAEGLFFNTLGATDGSGLYNERIKKVALPAYEEKHRYFQGHYESQFYFRFVADYLEVRKADYDLIFFRHAGNGRGYEEILRRLANKIVLYIPSNRIREVYCERRYTKDSGIGSALFSWWAYMRYWIREKRLMRSFLSPLKAVVTFTPEFGKIVSDESKRSVHMIYNRDGADTARVPARKSQVRAGEIKLIFLKGSGQEQKWAGLDRLISSVEAYPDIPIRLYITGNAINQKDRYARPFVTLTGRLPEDELEELINEVDLGVSNLSNYLIHFNETTNLKSRDYYSRGLPFIQGNTMPDIEGTAAAKYYLNIPNDDSIIDMRLVRDFAVRMRQDIEHPIKMHQFAEKYLDWNVTVAELAKDLRSL
jgi:hypothetical protein